MKQRKTNVRTIKDAPYVGEITREEAARAVKAVIDKGLKYDAGKPMFACLPPEGLLQLGAVAAMGATKYGLHNYRKGLKVSRTLDAAFRHLIAAIEGKEVDSVDGNNHLASVAWNALVALQTIKDHPELDDRYGKQET